MDETENTESLNAGNIDAEIQEDPAAANRNLVEEISVAYGIKCEDVVLERSGMANSVIGVESEKLALVQDPVIDNVTDRCEIPKDFLVPAVGFRDKNAKLDELDAGNRATDGKVRRGMHNVNSVFGFREECDRAGDGEESYLIRDRVGVKALDVAVDHKEADPNVVDTWKSTDDIQGENALAGGDPMCVFDSGMGKVDETERHLLLDDDVEGERRRQLASLESLLGKRLHDNESKESGVEKAAVEKRIKEEKEPEPCGSNWDGISLFVDIFGEANCSRESPLVVDISSEANSSEKSARDTLCSNETRAKEEQKDTSKCQFSVGDMVWIKTKAHKWWPGKICAHRDVSKYDGKPSQSGTLHVSYFGGGYVAWRNPSQLEPFHHNFEFIIQQDKSESFVKAVKRAVRAFGRHLKLDMTCSCILKGGEQPSNSFRSSRVLSAAEIKSRTLNELLTNQLEPVRFLKHIKSLALVVSVPGMLDFTITQNFLAAFYQLRGYKQSSVNQLQEQPVPGNKDEAEASKGAVGNCRKDTPGKGDVSSQSERKERKRNWSKSCEAGNSPEESVCAVVSPLDTSCAEETNLMKSEQSENESCGLGEKNGSGGESRERKKSKYLSHPYVNWKDKGLPSKTEDAEESNLEKEKLMMKHSEGTCLQIGSSDTGKAAHEEGLKELQGMIHTATSTKHKAEQVILENNSVSGLSVVKVKIETNDLLWRESGEMSSVMSHEKLDHRKREKIGEAISTPLKAKQATAIPDLNGDNVTISGFVADFNRKNAEPSSSSVGLLPTGPSASEAYQDKVTRDGFTARVSFGSGNIKETGSVKYQPVIGTLVGETMRARKKRNRKDKAASNCSSTYPVSGIPDLNGTPTEPIWSGKKLPESDSISPQAKDEQKKRRRARAAMLKRGRKKLTQDMLHGNDIGAALVLTFTSGAVVPSRDILVATFQRFGPLKLSETLQLNDSCSGQVVFSRTSDAIEALRSIEKCNPFGPLLFSYRLQKLTDPLETLKPGTPQACKLSAPSGALKPDTPPKPSQAYKLSDPSVALKQDTAPKPTQACLHVTGFSTAANPSAPKHSPSKALSIGAIKQNLEMMTLMLEKSGHSLPPETRNKLETEIKALLMKVSSMPGPSS